MFKKRNKNKKNENIREKKEEARVVINSQDDTYILEMQHGNYGYRNFRVEYSDVKLESHKVTETVTELGYWNASDKNCEEMISWLNQNKMYINVVSVTRNSGIASNGVAREGVKPRAKKLYYVETTIVFFRNNMPVGGFDQLPPQQQQQQQQNLQFQQFRMPQSQPQKKIGKVEEVQEY